ncbi:MAG: DinB family protein [Gemmatimonadaceae bacterium]
MTFDISARFLDRTRYYLGVEYPAKLRRALLAIPADRLWWRPNEDANSAGNLILHLTGNIRQWVVSGIGGAPDVRIRDIEFSTREGEGASVLLERLEKTLSEADAVLASLSARTLGESREIQGRHTTIFAAIYHVVEHFSTHTGQVILLAKMLAPGTVSFYEEDAGLARPTFLGDGRSDVD